MISITMLMLLGCPLLTMGRPQQATAVNAVTPPVPIILDERIPINNGNYGFRYQTGDGITRSETSKLVPQVDPLAPPIYETVGSYSFTHPDGTVNNLSFTAGVGGFQPVSNLLPTPFPYPAWVVEQIRFAEQQKAAAAAAGQPAPNGRR